VSSAGHIASHGAIRNSYKFFSENEKDGNCFDDQDTGLFVSLSYNAVNISDCTVSNGRKISE
jgi:hypothetical protein